MGGGDMIASAVLKNVTRKLRSELWGQIGLNSGFDYDMKMLKITLEKLAALLGDAEKKSFTDSRVESWLKELKSAAYDIEDMMFDFESNSKIWPQNRGQGWRAKLLQMLSAPKLFDMTEKMKRMSERLLLIAESSSVYCLEIETGFDKEEVVIKEENTFSDINEETPIIGRDEDREKLLSMLRHSYTEDDVSIISIVGLGGIGKSTLAWLLYSDGSVKENFTLQAWVNVSMEYNLKNILKDILESFGGSSRTPSNIKDICASINAKIKGQRFFIVLDDLWERETLVELRRLLRGGRKGSKIIITTRTMEVACGGDDYYELRFLSDEECWYLFSQRAFTSKSKYDAKLVEIGRDIAKNCSGLPLIAKALGYTMRFREGVHAWSDVIDNRIRQGGRYGSYYASIRTSYYYMPSDLKLCFTYCSIFPKGCIISKNELIQQWIALGFIQPTHKGLSPEDLGEEYVKYLLGMSFLQFSRVSKIGGELCMHAIVRDFAISVMGEEFLILDAESSLNNLAMRDNYRYALFINFNFEHLTEVCRTLPKLRAIHIHRLDSAHRYSPENTFLSGKFLRVIHLHSFHSPAMFLTSIKKLKQLNYLRASNLELIGSLLYSLQNLQALDFSYSYNLRSLPDSIGELRELKYLNLSSCYKLRVLPSSIGYLYKLSCLELQHCNKLQVLPESFGNLVNLRYLDMSYCRFRKLPKTFVNLTNLEVLKLNYCSELQVFPEPFALSSLKELYLHNCENLMNVSELSGDLTHLRKLDLEGCQDPLSYNQPGSCSSENEIVEISFHENVSHRDVEEANSSTKIKESFESQNGISRLEGSHLPIVIKKLEACVLPTVLRSTLLSFQPVFIKIEGSMKEVKNTFLVMQSFITIEGQQSNSITFKAWMDQSTKIAKEVEELVDEYASLIRETKEKPTGDRKYNDSLSNSWDYIAERFKQTIFLLHNLVDLKDDFVVLENKESSRLHIKEQHVEGNKRVHVVLQDQL